MRDSEDVESPAGCLSQRSPLCLRARGRSLRRTGPARPLHLRRDVPRPLGRAWRCRPGLLHEPLLPVVLREEEVEGGLEHRLGVGARVAMRERVARSRELREEALRDGDVEPAQVGGERLGLVRRSREPAKRVPPSDPAPSASRPEDSTASTEQDDEKDDDEERGAVHGPPRRQRRPPALRAQASQPTFETYARVMSLPRSSDPFSPRHRGVA
jgi:hypothetical protein